MFSDREPQALYSANVLERRIGKSLGFSYTVTLLTRTHKSDRTNNQTSGRHAILNWLIYTEFVEKKMVMRKFRFWSEWGGRVPVGFPRFIVCFVSSRFRTMLSLICGKTRIVIRVQNFHMQNFIFSHPVLAPSGQPGQTRPGHCEPKITFLLG